MLRFLIIPALLIASANAAIWPDHLGKFERKSVTPAPAPVPGENGKVEAEQASYGSFTVTAERYKDSTGAYAAALETRESPLQIGNYLVTCKGSCPKDLAKLITDLPKMSHAALPTLRNYLPAKNLVPHSERYILGPLGLAAAAPQISPAAVNFDFGAEGDVARYRTAKGEATLAVFSYPNMQMARQQAEALAKVPDSAVKRTGPLVVVAMAPGGQAASSQLLSDINYKAAVSSDDQQLPLVIRPQTAAQMVLGILALAGIVLGFCLISGLAFAGFRILSRRFGYTDAAAPFTSLRLDDK
ncbi:MAG TPA: hypothetical protein VKT81_23930 [Bryobacteraceae bacterium]|nr:hypothetical protein [Bryobacteraceae bacterium]